MTNINSVKLVCSYSYTFSYIICNGVAAMCKSLDSHFTSIFRNHSNIHPYGIKKKFFCVECAIDVVAIWFDVVICELLE